MSTIAAACAWPARAEAWLDDRGTGAWIAATVLGFIAFWPVGLFLLFYTLFFRKSGRRFERRMAMSMPGGMPGGMSGRGGCRSWSYGGPMAFRSSGNSAFDAYKRDTLDRLQREQEEFEAFLERLRASKDKSEFDQYMEDRARAARAEQATDAHRPDTDVIEGGSGPKA